MKLLAAALVFIALSAGAQQTINKPVLCGKANDVQSQLEKAGERVVWYSPSPVEKSNYIFYGNRETGTWSLVQIIEDIGCLVAFGEAAKAKSGL